MSKQTDAVLRRARRIKQLDAEIAKLKGKESLLRAERDKLEQEGVSLLRKAELDAVAGGAWNVALQEKDVPTLEDFDKFWKYVRTKNAPELMTRAVNSKAWRERDQNVPGVGTFTRRKLSITKRKQK